MSPIFCAPTKSSSLERKLANLPESTQILANLHVFCISCFEKRAVCMDQGVGLAVFTV